MKKYYFDYAATTPIDPRVVKAMAPYYSGIFGNPGSLHKFGQEASAAVFKARNKIAKLINCDYKEIIFTGSATEANNLAIRGVIRAVSLFSTGIGIASLQRRSMPASQHSDLLLQNQALNASEAAARKQKKPFRIITSQIEHESVLETCRDLEKENLAEIIYLPVSKSGIVDLKKLKESLNERTVLVSIMYANNEMGAIQPIREISEIINKFKEKNSFCPKPPQLLRQGPLGSRAAKQRGLASESLDERSWLRKNEFFSRYLLFHTDAAQAFNYLNCDVKKLGVDPVRNSPPPRPFGRASAGAISNGVNLMTFSSQKIYGPKGIGLLYVKNFGSIEGKKFISPIITGGGQEEGLRSGTENVAGIVGMAEAAELVSNSRELENKRLEKLQKYFIKKIGKIYPKFILNGPVIGDDRLSNNINLYFGDKKDLIFKLDMAGFAVSGGSACSARLAKPSHVLKAMGCSDEKASESIRISFGRQTTRQEINKLLATLKKVI